VQKTKEMGAKGRRMGVWFCTLSSISYLSSPASGSPSGVALRAHTARSAYPGTDKWAQVPLISRHWMVKWRCSSTEMEYPAHPVCVASRRFGDRGHDCLRPRDFR
jgi:hypothetical protein